MDFDPRLTNLGVALKPTPGATWVLASAKYQDENQSGGNHNVYFMIQDAGGQPVSGVTCVVDWVGRESGDQPAKVVTDASGQANVPIYANLDITLKSGPYFAFIGDPSRSDVVTGMGLPEHRNVNFLLTFAPAAGGAPPTPLESAIIAGARRVAWMPINTNAALYKFAQANKLGYPQTDEFEFPYGSDTYVGQVFNSGIVYTKKGDWTNIKWAKKPQ